jgi:hypothetical protein
VIRSNGDGSFTNVYYSTSGMEGYNINSIRDRAFAFDYNGDGKSDIFFYRPDSGGAGVIRSDGDGTFTRVYYSNTGIAGYGLGSARDQAFPFDYNGNGKSDLFLYRPDSNMACVIQSGFAYPDLLTGIKNGVGAVTSLTYENSSSYQNTLLPFIVHPVSKIIVDDGTGEKSAVTFSYSGGLFD